MIDKCISSVGTTNRDEHQLDTMKLKRLNRALRVISECNGALVQAKDEEVLLQRICDIICATGEYLSAWVGYGRNDHNKRVVPVASAGYAEGYLDSLDISWADTQKGSGATGRAIRSQEPVVCRDVHNDPQFKFWCKVSTEGCYQSSIAIPLLGGETPLGALNIYAGDVQAFDDEEVTLLQQLADDLAYGIRSLRTQQERDSALSKLEEESARLQSITSSVQDAIIMLDGGGKIIFWNEAATRMFGHSGEEAMGKNPYHLLAPVDSHERIEKAFKSFSKTGKGYGLGRTLDLTGRRKGGEEFPVELSLSGIRKQGAWHAVAVVRDITQRKRAEAEVAEGRNLLDNALEGTVAAIAKAVEARDPYTAGHQRRVAQFSVSIGRELGLSEDQVKGLHMGATIHDIGKIHVPAELLSKPTRLSEVEFALMRGHAQVGYDILKDVVFPWPLADIAHQHHERMDGSGYPQGLKGEETCLEARIVAVADVVEAMASHRPYRAALGVGMALKEIKAGRGKRYDADVVDACVKLLATTRLFLG